MLEYIFIHFYNDPIFRAQTLKHKKRYQQKQINKRLVSNGFRPKYKV